MKSQPYSPHRERRSIINFLIGFGFIALLAMALFGCSPKYGCPAIHKNNLKGYGIIKKSKCKEGISVVYKDNKAIWALDYLSKPEYDSLQLCLSRLNK